MADVGDACTTVNQVTFLANNFFWYTHWRRALHWTHSIPVTAKPNQTKQSNAEIINMVQTKWIRELRAPDKTRTNW